MAKRYESQVREEYLKKFDKILLSINDSKYKRDIFVDFLDFNLYFLCTNPTKEQGEKTYNTSKETIKKYIQLTEINNDYLKNFGDFLGLYYNLNLADKNKDQFFTPQNVANLMAEITMQNNDSMTISDNCCGSGTLLIGHIKKVENPQEYKYFANDLDLVCVKMCLLNLIISDVKGIITCGNGLTDDPKETFIINRYQVDYGEKKDVVSLYTYFSKKEVQKWRNTQKEDKNNEDTQCSYIQFEETKKELNQLELF